MLRDEPEGFDTRAVRAGRRELARLGVHAPPIDLSSTYPLPELDLAVASLDALAAGEAEAPSPVYARLRNPTVARFEAALAELEGAESAVAFASGMAALTALLLAATDRCGGARGRHVVAVRPLYGGSDHLLASGLLGLDVDFVRPDRIADAIRPDTALVVLETPANPTVELIDVAAAVAAARGVPVAVDSTFATPVLERPLAHGAAFALHSATKFLGGHGDVVGGVVATSGAWAKRLRQVRILTGALLHPLAAYLLQRGLPTLPIRVRRMQASADRLAHELARHPAVVAARYPTLPGGDPRGLLGRQMAGPGAIVAFEVVGGVAGARTVIAALERITHAVSLGSVDTLIQHPAGLTHRLVDPAARREAGIADGLLRLSVGLEEPRDLWADLERALDRALAAAHPSEPSLAPEPAHAA
jgi:cystathionine beta-lyase/cystathionine gamma-synthase